MHAPLPSVALRGLALLALLGACPLVAPAPAPVSASFQVIVTPGAALGHDPGPSPAPQAFSRTFEHLGNRIAISARATGGLSGASVAGLPLAEVALAGRATGAFGASAVARVEYEYRVIPVPGVTPPGAAPSLVPLVATASGRVEVTGPSHTASALARVRIAYLGGEAVRHTITAGGTYAPPQDDFFLSVAFQVPAGTYGVVEMDARGTTLPALAPTSARAVADPMIIVDPAATFESGDETLRYADFYRVEVPSTIGNRARGGPTIQALPVPAAVAGAGALAILGARLRRRGPATPKRRGGP